MTAFPSSARQFNAAPSSLPPESLTRFFFPPIRSSFLDKFYPAFLFLFSFFPPASVSIHRVTCPNARHDSNNGRFVSPFEKMCG